MKDLAIAPTWRIQAKKAKQPRKWGKGGFKFPLLLINNLSKRNLMAENAKRIEQMTTGYAENSNTVY